MINKKLRRKLNKQKENRKLLARASMVVGDIKRFGRTRVKVDETSSRLDKLRVFDAYLVYLNKLEKQIKSDYPGIDAGPGSSPLWTLEREKTSVLEKIVALKMDGFAE